MVEMDIRKDQGRPTGSTGHRGNRGGIAVTLIPPDGEPNPNNPYDRLPPEEREKRIVELCARIHRRRSGDEAGKRRSSDG